jgi:hypothetical protein
VCSKLRIRIFEFVVADVDIPNLDVADFASSGTEFQHESDDGPPFDILNLGKLVPEVTQRERL